MKTFAIIGANYGDEGKGLMTDYVCYKANADVVVRFNGGAQAGHTVIEPGGMRHVFHHFGSGALQNIPTFLSKYFIVNPALFREEAAVIGGLVYVDPDAVVTTPFDMLINQAFERAKGHGSCGVGINETMQRSKLPGFRITAADLLSKRGLNAKLASIWRHWVPMRLRMLDLPDDIFKDTHELSFVLPFMNDVDYFLGRAKITSRLPGGVVVFEGAQGLALDQHAEGFPHVTHSNTGMTNVRELCTEWGLPVPNPIYVTRTYLNRHGAGPLPGEEPMPTFVKDQTNVPHEFQGTLRYAPFTYDNILAMQSRIALDAQGARYELAVTCCDQSEQGLNRLVHQSLPIRYRSHGPTRNSVFDYNLKVTA